MVTFDFGRGAFSGFARISSYTLPSPAYLTFSARTGGATNNHRVKAVALIDSWIAPPPPPPPPPLPKKILTSELALTGSAILSDGDCTGGNHLQTRGWYHSAAICADVGARLCTGAELTADEARGTGCNADDAITWTSDPCPDDGTGKPGHMSQRGSAKQGTDAAALAAACSPDSTNLALRCCATGAHLCAQLHGRYLLRIIYMRYLYVEFVCKYRCKYRIYIIRSRYGGWPTEDQPWGGARTSSHGNGRPRGDPNICGESDNGLGGVVQLTQVQESQQGTAFVPLTGVGSGLGPDFTFHARYEMYTGEGSGADGQCVNIGARDLGGRAGEDGVAQGVAICFDEWSNQGDHGVSMFYNGDVIWENHAPCNNREDCLPVSLYDDAEWHVVEVSISPKENAAGTMGSAAVRFSLDEGLYGGFATIPYFRLPQPTYLGFSARTGAATNNHWIKDITTTMPPPPPLDPLPASGFDLSGSASLVGEVIKLTTVTPLSQDGFADSLLQIRSSPADPWVPATSQDVLAIRFWMYPPRSMYLVSLPLIL